jgi:hypothetical protein
MIETEEAPRAAEADSESAPVVRRFREILLWPLQLEPLAAGEQIQRHWELLPRLPGGSVWAEVLDEFGCDPREFQERHYSEFVTFLPTVQRFLYGEGTQGAVHSTPTSSSIRVFRRRDIAKVRLTLHAGDAPLEFDIAHIDLNFFYDVDVVLLAVEVFGQDLPFDTVQDVLFRFGRAYPPHWDSESLGATCPHRTEWLDASGAVLAASDFGDRARYLEFVCQHRAPCIAAHWDFVMRPLVHHSADQPGPLRYRQLEYHRMPLMAYLALDDPSRLTRADYVRLGLLTGPGDSAELPFSERYLARFERRFCYDRYYRAGHADVGATRTLTCGHDLITVGHARSAFFTDSETGFLAQFRHQYSLLFLIAHLHKASLLMLSNRLAWAIQDLDIGDVSSVRRFKRTIRQSHEIFLRFTHRYWFHELSIQVQAREIFALIASHLGNDELYRDVRERMLDMSHYLDSDNMRRQANVVVRLTVITIVGLVGTTATGFLGMNLIGAADSPWPAKIAYFAVVFVPIMLLLFYTVMKSKRLSDFFEVLSDERASLRRKLGALAQVWGRHP